MLAERQNQLVRLTDPKCFSLAFDVMLADAASSAGFLLPLPKLAISRTPIFRQARHLIQALLWF